MAPFYRWETERVGVLVISTESRTQLSRSLPGLPNQDSGGPSAPPGVVGPPTFTRNATVLLALLLRVKLVAIALAAPIAEADALPLDSIKCPELHIGSAWPLDYGEVTLHHIVIKGKDTLVTRAFYKAKVRQPLNHKAWP